LFGVALYKLSDIGVVKEDNHDSVQQR